MLNEQLNFKLCATLVILSARIRLSIITARAVGLR